MKTCQLNYCEKYYIMYFTENFKALQSFLSLSMPIESKLVKKVLLSLSIGI